jgi:hypothetical protein
MFLLRISTGLHWVQDQLRVTSATGIGTTNNLWIGKVTNQAAGAGDYIYYSFSSVANMKMYNRALAPSEIAQNFQALRGRFGI